MGARRLATAAMARTARFRRRAGARPKRAARCLALEDSRQPSAKPAPAGVDRPAHGRMAGACQAVRRCGRERRFSCCSFPRTCSGGRRFANRVRGVRLRDHFRSERDNLASSLHQVLLHSAFLAHQSVVMVDAIGRTLARLVHQAASPRVGDGRRHGGAPRRRSGPSCCAGCGWPR